MTWKLLITIALISSLYTSISAQKSKKTPDEISRINGKTFACRIDSVNSEKIYFMFKSSGKQISTYLNLDELVSYTYNGEKVFLRKDVHTAVEQEPESNPKPAWKKPAYPLHVDDQPDWVVRLCFLPPGILTEGKLAPNTTFLVNVWTGITYTWSSNMNGEKTSQLIFTPSLTFGPRFYTNLDSRTFHGKRVDYYSGRYVAVQGTIVFLGEHNYHLLSAIAGFQRTLGRKGYWNIGVGLGVSSYDEHQAVSLLGDFGIGIILSK